MTIEQERTASKQILVAGLSSHGKTTYLAALWYRVNRLADARLRLREIPEDVDYLNHICDAWLMCQTVGRTSAAVTHRVVLPLETSGHTPVDIVLPDYSGEFITNAWATRRWPGELDTYVKSADGLILLVNPAFVYPVVRIQDVEPPASLGAAPPDPTIRPTVYDPAGAATQIELVDFLQLVRWRKRASRTLPTAVVVSAWDLVKNQGRSPSEWLATCLPLLDQFLASNRSYFHSEVFAISAQGGAYPADGESLTGLDPKVKTIALAPDGSSTSDVTLPLSWLVQMAR